MTIVELLDALEEELEGSKKGFLSERRLVDADKCLDTLDEIRENLPLELERAANIMKERRQILIDAENEAQQNLDAAQKRAEEMVSETEIIRMAELDAKQIVDLAKQNAKEIRGSAKAYATELLEDLNNQLEGYCQQITKDVEKFQS